MLTRYSLFYLSNLRLASVANGNMQRKVSGHGYDKNWSLTNFRGGFRRGGLGGQDPPQMLGIVQLATTVCL